MDEEIDDDFVKTKDISLLTKQNKTVRTIQRTNQNNNTNISSESLEEQDNGTKTKSVKRRLSKVDFATTGTHNVFFIIELKHELLMNVFLLYCMLYTDNEVMDISSKHPRSLGSEKQKTNDATSSHCSSPLLDEDEYEHKHDEPSSSSSSSSSILASLVYYYYEKGNKVHCFYTCTHI